MNAGLSSHQFVAAQLAGHDIFVFSGFHVAAQFVGYGPAFDFSAWDAVAWLVVLLASRNIRFRQMWSLLSGQCNNVPGHVPRPRGSIKARIPR